MGLNKKIKVLIVDDSLVFREVITMGISSDPDIEVVAKAIDPFDARDKILEFEPDVMICDVQMPKMNGIEFAQKLIPQYPIPIIIITNMNGLGVEIKELVGVDFLKKPDVQSLHGVEKFIKELIRKIKNIAPAEPGSKKMFDPKTIIAIGASTGGTQALSSIFSKLPPRMPGIVVVQHIPSGFSRMFAQRLNSQMQLQIKEVENGDYVEEGKVLIAPGDKHIKIKKVGDRYKVEVFSGEKVNGHCPSVDVLFESVAKEAGKNAVGIILTGMGYDGAKGLLAMRRKGARTIGQDEKSSIVYGMPKVAYNIGAVEKQTSLSKIPYVLLSMLK